MDTADEPVTNSTLLRELWNPQNNEEAWRTFLQRYQPLIDGWCRRSHLQEADVEEVGARVRFTLARALRDFRYDRTQRFRGWLRTVVQNTLSDYGRELARRPGARGSGDPDVQDQLEQTASLGRLAALVQELDDSLQRDLDRARQIMEHVQERVERHTWQAYWQTAIEEQPATEVAARLGMSAAAVYVAKNRVGKMLRQEGARLQNLVSQGEEKQP